MGKHQSHPELGQQGQQSLYSFQLKSRRQVLREKMIWVVTGLGLGLAMAAGMALMMPLQPGARLTRQLPFASDAITPLEQGLQQGMRAAELTQSADLREDWIDVAMGWQTAIAQLKTVPPSSTDYALAQEKIGEYQRNLAYAESNVTTRPARKPEIKDYWTLGSDRELVLATQGLPDRVRQVSSSCYETLHYNNSMIELHNGYVKSYDNFDSNLKVLEVGEPAFSTRSPEHHWTLGSSKETVLQLQGTPDRSNEFQSDQFTTLDYGESFILFQQNRVIGYLNSNGNLKVSTSSLVSSTATQAQYWSIGSTRTEVLQAQQQTPQAVSRSDHSCEEIFHFGNSEVHFRQGLVTGYRNVDQNLSLR
jgi:hypothetical protein